MSLAAAAGQGQPAAPTTGAASNTSSSGPGEY